MRSTSLKSAQSRYYRRNREAILRDQQLKQWRRYCKNTPAALADRIQNPPEGISQTEVKNLLIAARAEFTRCLIAINEAEKRKRSIDPTVIAEDYAKAFEALAAWRDEMIVQAVERALS